MNKLHITGFDSAWGGKQRGAICDLTVDRESGEIEFDNPPESVTWSEAINKIGIYAKNNHHVIAIDQGLIVPNIDGMRPVELRIAKALGSMHCSAYPSNRSNISCYGEGAGIWKFQSELKTESFEHKPMSIPKSEKGKFYFECYPHPSIIAMLNRDKILKYKCRHKSQNDWNALLEFLKSLPVKGLSQILDQLTPQNKGNEDRLDSIVCAWIAYLWWKKGTENSLMVGSMSTGYIVTPCTVGMGEKLRREFSHEVNNESGAAPPVPAITTAKPEVSTRSTSDDIATKPIDTEKEIRAQADSWLSAEWSEEDDLIATDTTNLSRNMRKGSRRTAINPWMDRFDSRLLIKFVEEDGEPEVAFIPHSHSRNQMTLMADRNSQPGVWFQLVAGASKKNPLRFRVKYRYLTLN
jgi:predicted RNase H-like nuclease